MRHTTLHFKLLLLTLVFLGFCFKVEAVSIPIFHPFGGKTVHVKYCTCSQNLYINYIPTTPLTMPKALSYRPGVSTLYSYYQIFLPGTEVLGTTMSPDVCTMAPFCTPYPPSTALPPELIRMVGTSSIFGAAINGAQTGISQPPLPQSDQSGQNQQNRPQQTARTSEPVSANGQTEQQVRDELAQNGVQTAPGLSPTLSPVSGLPQNAVNGMEDLSRDCGPGCNVTVTSAARQPGNPTPPGSHGTGKPVVDLAKDPGLDNYITSNAQSVEPVYNGSTFVGNRYTMPNGDTYLDEHPGSYNSTTGAHWHTVYNASHNRQA